MDETQLGGESLESILKQGPLPLGEALELALALAEAVEALHERRIVHNRINPANVQWNRATRRLALADSGVATRAALSSVAIKPQSVLAGVLEYIAPEQTGRINRYVDYRADLYSVGATLYRVLADRPPFQAEDAMGLIHCHIARAPIPPHVLNPAIPETLSRIVLMLMAKMADDRYQSAWGLKEDLRRCLRELADHGAVSHFELAANDPAGRLRLPQRLYGRERETGQLLAALERTAAGEREVVLVAGYAGVGKTALVNELRGPVAEKRGYFTEGKFEQLQRNVPYQGWIQVFAGFVNQLLMGSDAELAQWRTTILSAVGGVGRVLTDVVPNLAIVIGPQPEVPALGPTEALNRLNYVFLQLIDAIGTPTHPLTVFLDDLQWIDASSLNLLATLAGSTGVSNVLVVGAYRDNEVDAMHPLTRALATLTGPEARVERLSIGPMAEDTTNELVANALRAEPSLTAPLSRVVYSKTEGNPFFVLQTLQRLVEERVVLFDAQQRAWSIARKGWSWPV